MKKKKYPTNPLAWTMSYENRIKRYCQDKDKMLRNNMGASAEELAQKHERIRVWWNV